MGTRKIVPLRPARKEGATDAPTPLTLADVTISHVFRENKEVTLSGAEVAAILEGTQHLHASEEKSDFVDAYAMYFEIVGIT